MVYCINIGGGGGGGFSLTPRVPEMWHNAITSGGGSFLLTPRVPEMWHNSLTIGLHKYYGVAV